MYVLILLISVSAISQSHSMALTSQVFSSEKACAFAGEKATKLNDSAIKKVSFVCVPQ